MKKSNKDVVFFDNIKDIILNSSELYGDKAAFITKVGGVKSKTYITKTYKELVEDVYSFGTALFAMGLKDCRIAVAGRNSYPWMVAYITNLFCHNIVVPLDKELQTAELEDSLVRSEAVAFVYDSKYEDKISEIRAGAKTSVKYWISTEQSDLCFEALLENGRKLIAEGDTSFINEKPDPEALSILLFTSGTTDKSKAVMLAQKGLAYNIYDMHMTEDVRSTDTNIAFLPFHHIFGSVGALFMLACGVTTTFPDGLRYIKQNLAEYGVSLFIGVPLLLDGMKSVVEKEVKKQGKENLIKVMRKVTRTLFKMKIDIRRKVFAQIINALGGKMRLVISGGAPLDPSTADFYKDIGIDLVQGYGLTETSPVIAAETMYHVRRGSVGVPMNSVEVKIDNKDADGIGEIKVKGPTIMLGYYKNTEATDAVLSDGWFNTGDLGYFDKDGYLFITGRKKDMIVLKNGKKIFPEEVETLVNHIEGVTESLIYGVSDDGGISYDKIVCKAVYDETVFKGKTTEEIHDIIWAQIKEINKTLPMYKYIKGLTVTDVPFVKTTTNKIKRSVELSKN